MSQLLKVLIAISMIGALSACEAKSRNRNPPAATDSKAQADLDAKAAADKAAAEKAKADAAAAEKAKQEAKEKAEKEAKEKAAKEKEEKCIAEGKTKEECKVAVEGSGGSTGGAGTIGGSTGGTGGNEEKTEAEKQNKLLADSIAAFRVDAIAGEPDTLEFTVGFRRMTGQEGVNYEFKGSTKQGSENKLKDVVVDLEGVGDSKGKAKVSVKCSDDFCTLIQTQIKMKVKDEDKKDAEVVASSKQGGSESFTIDSNPSKLDLKNSLELVKIVGISQTLLEPGRQYLRLILLAENGAKIAVGITNFAKNEMKIKWLVEGWAAKIADTAKIKLMNEKLIELELKVSDKPVTVKIVVPEGNTIQLKLPDEEKAAE
jgi:hypothetical protein